MEQPRRAPSTAELISSFQQCGRGYCPRCAFYGIGQCKHAQADVAAVRLETLDFEHARLLEKCQNHDKFIAALLEKYFASVARVAGNDALINTLRSANNDQAVKLAAAQRRIVELEKEIAWAQHEQDEVDLI